MWAWLKRIWGCLTWKGDPNAVSIPAGGTAVMRCFVPKGMTPNAIQFYWRCGDCGREHMRLLSLEGGDIQGICQCGSDYHLEVGPAEYDHE